MASMEEDKKFINIVLLGRTGRGKSSTGNSIIGSNVFLSKRGASAVTMNCELHSKTREDGVVVNVIDTPGLFDPELSNKETISEIGKVLELLPGNIIHCALFVLNGDDVRFTAEEQCAMRLLRLLFGPKLMEFSIFVFTRGDYFDTEESGHDVFEQEVISPLNLEELSICAAKDEKVTVEAVANTNSNSSSGGGGGALSLKRWLKLAGNRYILFNNIQRPQRQLDRMYEMIESNITRMQQRDQLLSQGDSLAPLNNGCYCREDFLEHANTLTEAQKQALHDPLTPERQAETARALAGQVGSLKKEVGGLKDMLQQMSTEQTATLMQIINQLRQPQQPPQTPTEATLVNAVTSTPS